ncbi:MAG: peptide-methionine (S)-S-oxide reductase MsrA [Methylovulum sp.]|nr:peptide-methionine (S)-S-oxide reductase MsrA [Methylovulum sp.]
MLTRLFIIMLAIGASMTASAEPEQPPVATALFAGGCFWCMQPPFDALPGVVKTVPGYTGGKTENPSYEQVSAGGTGHVESLQITYDPAKISYEKLLDVYWHNIDPTDASGQFCDKGDQYRSIIFYQNEAQKHLAEQSKTAWQQNKPFKDDIKTQIIAAPTFYPAEDYHQDYYKKNPLRYQFYRFNCGRDQRLKALWGTSTGH